LIESHLVVRFEVHCGIHPLVRHEIRHSVHYEVHSVEHSEVPIEAYCVYTDVARMAVRL
jgi:hypothetical protein